MSRRFIAVITAGLLAAILAAGTGAAARELPALAADPLQTSVSGISSGAYMAGQYQIAHSATVIGAAIIAGGPYGCAEARYGSYLPGPIRLSMNASQSVNGCMFDLLELYGIPDVAGLEQQARALAAAGRIDPIEGLARHKMYLFSGGKDHLVRHRHVVSATELYLRLGLPRAAIKTAHLDGAGHGFVTVRDNALACGLSQTPFVVHCGEYDQARDLLAQFYDLAGGRTETPAGELFAFDQTPFVRDIARTHLSGEGMVFVPQACRLSGGCRIHIAFHGCQQDRKAVGDAFVSRTGYLNWADRNQIIVLFPDVAADATLNPLGCWDWWGYTGFDYLTRDAPQIVAVRRMVERLSARP